MDKIYITDKQRKKALISFFAEIKSGNFERTPANIKKAEQMLNLLIHHNPFTEVRSDLKCEITSLPVVHDLGMTRGFYAAGTQLLTINEGAVFNGDVAILLDTIGHEMRHYNQDKAITEMNYPSKQKSKVPKELAEKFEAMASDFNGMQFRQDEYENMMKFLDTMPTSGFLNYHATLPQEEKENLDKIMALGMYFTLTHEIDAREQGLEYSKSIIESILSDPEVDAALKQKLGKDLQGLVEYNQEMQPGIEKSQSLAGKLYDSIKQVSLDSMLEEYISAKQGIGSQNTPENIKRVVGLILKDKSKKEKVECLYASIHLGSTSIGDVVITDLAKSEKFTPEQRSKLQLAIMEQLKSGDYPPSSFNLNYQEILTPEQGQEIVDYLMEHDQVRSAQNFIRSYCVACDVLRKDKENLSPLNRQKLNGVQKVINSYQKSMDAKAVEFIDRYNSGDPTLCLNNYIFISYELLDNPFMSSVGADQNSAKAQRLRFDLKSLDQEVLSRSARESAEDLERYRKIYGEAAYLEFIGKRDLRAVFADKNNSVVNLDFCEM